MIKCLWPWHCAFPRAEPPALTFECLLPPSSPPPLPRYREPTHWPLGCTEGPSLRAHSKAPADSEHRAGLQQLCSFSLPVLPGGSWGEGMGGDYRVQSKCGGMRPDKGESGVQWAEVRGCQCPLLDPGPGALCAQDSAHSSSTGCGRGCHRRPGAVSGSGDMVWGRRQHPPSGARTTGRACTHMQQHRLVDTLFLDK